MRPLRFTVTDDHLKLAQRMYVDWCGDEFGAPEIDPKRPYGNSDVYGDIAEILGIDASDDDYEPFTIAQQQHMEQLHREMQTVLQIALRVGDFEVGEYETEPYRVDWRRVP